MSSYASPGRVPADPPPIHPTPAAALRVAELAAGLPGAAPTALNRARAAAARAAAEGWSEAVAGAAVWRQVDRLAVACHLGRTRGWAWADCWSRPFVELLAALEGG